MNGTMKTTDDLFQNDGHLTDATLAVAADGHELAAPEADAHLQACEPCTARLVAFATISVDAGDALRAMAASPRARPIELPAHGSSWWPVLAGLAVSLASLVPLFSHLSTRVLRAAPAIAHAGPVLLRGLTSATASRGPGAVLITLASSLCLVVVGALVSREARLSGVSS